MICSVVIDVCATDVGSLCNIHFARNCDWQF